MTSVRAMAEVMAAQGHQQIEQHAEQGTGPAMALNTS